MVSKLKALNKNKKSLINKIRSINQAAFQIL
jgi:hypothetical protein